MIEYKVRVYKNDTDQEDRTEWYSPNGKLHREDGPAIEYANGDKVWYKNGQLHREDGPANEFNHGKQLYWYLNNEEYSEKQYNTEMANRKSSCAGKIVEFNGKKYKLVEVR